MSNLIKAYTDELNAIQENISDLWSKYEDATTTQERFDILIQIVCLNNRKAALKAQINDLKQ